MSIVALHKVTLFGLHKDRPALLAGLQSLGCMHPIPLHTAPADSEPAPSAPDEDADKALRHLLDVRRRRRQMTNAADFDFEAVVQSALDNRQHRRDIEDRLAFLRQRIEELTPWGNFVLPPPADLAGYRFWFYQVPHAHRHYIEALEQPWQQVHRDNRHAYIVVISREEPSHDSLPLPRTHTGRVSLHALQQQLTLAEIELEDIQAEHEALSRWGFLLSQNLARIEDHAALQRVQSQVLEQDGVCVLQGWVPQRDLDELRAFADRQGLALLSEVPTLEDKPPTLLDNPPAVNGGEDLVSFYQTPAYATWDPSRTVFFSFALFFAMILADAGYALLLAGVLTAFRQRLTATATGRRLRVLALTVLATSVVYGILVGSYFGWSPPENWPLYHLKLIDLDNFDAMMHLSIIIGCLHLGFANAMMALQRGPFPANAVPLGWIAVIVGGLLFWFGYDGIASPPAKSLGIAAMAGGMLLILLFGGHARAPSFCNRLLCIFERLVELTNITKLFGDILSYLRLFALGLASSSLAVTFNQLAGQVYDAVPGLGLLLAILILVLGHLINLALGIISGFVHGLRLNFIEFFNWSISAEGYPFRPFARKTVDNR